MKIPLFSITPLIESYYIEQIGVEKVNSKESKSIKKSEKTLNKSIDDPIKWIYIEFEDRKSLVLMKKSLDNHVFLTGPLRLKKAKTEKDLEYWKKKLLDILRLQKSLSDILYPDSVPNEAQGLLLKARGFPVGTIRNWRGKEHKKMANGKWVRTYKELESRGAKQAIRNVRRKIISASTMEELLEIVKQNASRFQDDKGKMLPIIKEFIAAVRNTEIGRKPIEEPIIEKVVIERKKMATNKTFEIDTEEADKIVDRLIPENEVMGYYYQEDEGDVTFYAEVTEDNYINNIAINPYDILEKPKEEPVDIQKDLTKKIISKDFEAYGSWNPEGKHLKPAQREKLNQEIAELVNKDFHTQEEKDIIRLYSGFGGTKVADERGLLYDYYTSPPVAKMIFQAINKINPIKKNDKILEPACGTGVFFDVAPEGVEKIGVEYDPRTAKAADILQPESKITTGSFEQFNLYSKKDFDIVIGNSPFGKRSVETSFVDSDTDANGKTMPGEDTLDRYFISKSLDNLKSGGTIGMVAYSGVMNNKTNIEWRKEMLRKGQFVGAMQLPNESFKHTQTGVSPDVYYFKKHSKEVADKLKTATEEQLKESGAWNEEWVNGGYYDKHPENRLGKAAVGNFGVPITVGKMTDELLNNAVKNFAPVIKEIDVSSLPSPVIEKPKDNVNVTPEEAAAVQAKTLLVGSTKTVNGITYFLNGNHRWERVEGQEDLTEKIPSLTNISLKVNEIRRAMQSDVNPTNLQNEVRELLDKYKEDYGSYPNSDKSAAKLIKTNPSLKSIHEAINVTMESGILNNQNIYAKEVRIVDGHQPDIVALKEIQQNLAKASPEIIRNMYPDDAEKLMDIMIKNPDVFIDYLGNFQLREDFIAGDAWTKIDALRNMMDGSENPNKIQYGIDELEKAIGWVSIEDADVMPQSSWIPQEIIQKWSEEEYDQTLYRRDDGTWDSSGSYSKNLTYFMNFQKQRGGSKEENEVETMIFNQSAEESFKNFISTHEDLRLQMEELYNRKFNTELGVPNKTYTVNIEGWDKYALDPWQWQSIHHLYEKGKGMSAMGTGFGKTLAGVGLMALLRQEGKIKRPLFQVPNNKVKDWLRIINAAMPGLKVGAVDPEVKGYSSRDVRYQMYQDLANTDYDVLILPESSASEIQLSEEEDAAITNDVILSQMPDLKTEKQREKAKDSLRGRMISGKKNQTITFEDLGVDSIFVDECFPYKTKVLTELGYMAIGEIVKKRLTINVVSYNIGLDKIELKPITAWMPKRLDHKIVKINLSNGGYLISTHNHKIYTEEGGYEYAINTTGRTVRILRRTSKIKKKSLLFPKMFFKFKDRKRKASRENLRMVWKEFFFQIVGKGEQQEKKILFRHLCSILPFFSSSYNRAKESEISCFGERKQREAKSKNSRADEIKQPNEEKRDQGESKQIIERKTISREERGKWDNPGTSKNIARSNRIRVGIRNKNKRSQTLFQFITTLLQDRFSNSRKEDSNRAGREFPQTIESSREGQEKGCSFEFIRVDSIEILEQRSYEQYGFCDSKDSTVYDIEVEGNHNFIAEGMLVSNCHNYKNLFSSSLSRETGLNDGRRSDRALSMYKKNEYIRKHNGDKNVFFFTATPLTNSPLEYYNMLSHIAPEEFTKLGISNINDFIKNFADIQQSDEYDWASDKMVNKKVLKGFKNLRSLQDMFFKYTDFQNDPNKIGIEKPKPTKRANILEQNDAQVAELKDLSAQLAAYKKKSKDQRDDNENTLTYFSKMRTASLDLELYDPRTYKDWENPKLTQLADNAFTNWQATDGGQVVFCDRVLSSDKTFNMHEKIKQQLITKGFKADEIVMVNGITKSGATQSDKALQTKVSDVIDGFNSGKYKVCIGTTGTIGEGVNLQKNSAALHHVDIPYRPSDFIQRNGRIDRQGNKQKTVELHTYASAGTTDNYSIAKVSGKENWINTLLKTKSSVFTNPDGEGFDMDEMMISLQGEWGRDTAALKEQIKERKEAKVKQRNVTAMNDTIKKLSTVRGALESYGGEKGSRIYKNMINKEAVYVEALKGNPEFHNHELTNGERTPFMYDSRNKKVMKVGDYYSKGKNLYKVKNIDFKKGEVKFYNVDSPDYEGYDLPSWSIKRGFGTYGYQDPPRPLPNTFTAQDAGNFKKAVSGDFFTLSDQAKKEHYGDYIIAGDGKTTYSSQIDAFYLADNKVTVFSHNNGVLLNPYMKEDLAKIKKHVSDFNKNYDFTDKSTENSNARYYIKQATQDPAIPQELRDSFNSQEISQFKKNHPEFIEKLKDSPKWKPIPADAKSSHRDMLETLGYEVDYKKIEGTSSEYGYHYRRIA